MNAHRPEAAARSKTPTGDTIAEGIRNRDNQPGKELPYSDLAKDLNDAHARRPGFWQQDLDKVNKALHEKGMLPGLDVVGTRGQDLVTKNKDGKTVIVDATGNQRQHEVTDGSACKKIGKDPSGELNNDGSGKYHVQKGDNPWNMSKDILKAQGNENPTNNQIANYIKELQKYNGVKDLGKLQPGAEVKFGPSTKAGDHTEFTPDRARDQIKGMNDKVDQDATKYNEMIQKYSSRDALLYGKSLSKDDIDKALASKDTPIADKKALEYLQKNYDSMKFSGTFGQAEIYPQQVEQWKQREQKKINDAAAAY